MTSAALKTTTQLVGRNEVTNDEGKVVEFQEVRTYPGNMVLTVLATLGFIDSWGVTLPPNAPQAARLSKPKAVRAAATGVMSKATARACRMVNTATPPASPYQAQRGPGVHTRSPRVTAKAMRKPTATSGPKLGENPSRSCAVVCRRNGSGICAPSCTSAARLNWVCTMQPSSVVAVTAANQATRVRKTSILLGQVMAP